MTHQEETRGPPVVVVGAGVAGLSTAIALASEGARVTVLEAHPRVGGKMREVDVAERAIDSGPTVMTMRWVFDELFEAAGAQLDERITLEPMEILARHFWRDGTTLDLFTDPQRTATAIAEQISTVEADGYLRFCEYTQRLFELTEQPFIRAQRPTMRSAVAHAGVRGLIDFAKVDWQRSMWKALGDFFKTPELRQLFGRYATYYGSSPFLAPATLNLIAHVERTGVHRVRGGMYRLAEALEALATELGVEIRCGTPVRAVRVHDGRIHAVEIDRETIPCRHLVFCGAASALTTGRLGDDVRLALGKKAVRKPAERSLSAVTFSTVAGASGVPLAHHSVFFSDDYAAEFDALIGQREIPSTPTVYICAQDRVEDRLEVEGPERLLVLVNAPPTGDTRDFEREIERCKAQTLAHLQTCGLTLEPTAEIATTPTHFEALFPATGGALYGGATHSFLAPFQRFGARTKIPGLYVAGGGVHPGAGVPMVALSGRIAARCLIEDAGASLPTSPVSPAPSAPARASIAS